MEADSLIARAMKPWHDIMELKDPRLDGYFMMSNPLPSFVICFFYVYLVQSLLPRYMENKKPYNLKRIMMVYNFAMVLLSGYTFLEFGVLGWFWNYSYGCQLPDLSNSPSAIRMINICWCFYITKFIELLDTVFFCLRKKNNQVSFLHVFHHAVMPVSWWFGVRFVPGGLGTFHAWLNSFIHFMMYIYYGVAAMGPQYQKYLWWKKYMTAMQMTQFALVVVHTGQLFFIQCDYTMLFAWWILSYAVIFLILFTTFYNKTYTKKTPVRTAKTKPEHAEHNGVTLNNNNLANGIKME